ncbi:MAG: alpha/beta fold hydrolase [Acidobacteriota bacterium]
MAQSDDPPLPPPTGEASPWLDDALRVQLAADGADFEHLDDPARELAESPFLDRASFADRSTKTGNETVYTLTHDVPLPSGRTLRVYEHFTAAAWFQWPRRALVMPTSFYASSWRIPVDGYDGAERVARRGFFAYTMDLVGYADSPGPANGNDADFAVQIEAVETVVRYVRFFRWVPKVDVLGEGYGASIATQLAADDRRIRSVVMTDNLYLEQQAGPATDPAFQQIILDDPDGYIFVPPEATAGFLIDSPPEVADYFLATQAGLFPAASFTVAFSLPFYDPTHARVPGLVIQSEFDLVALPEDAAALAADYGSAAGQSGAELVILDGAVRGARFNGRSGMEAYWAATFAFLDPPLD